MAHKCYFIALFLHCVILTFSLNNYTEETGSNGEDIWRSISDFIPVQSQSFGNITIRQIMSMEFHFIFKGRTNDPRAGFEENFFRVGYNAKAGESCDGEYSHYPSLWLSSTHDYLHILISDTSSCQSLYSLSEYGTIDINTSYHMLIAFNNTVLTVFIADGQKPDWRTTFTKEPTLSQFIGVEVPVWFMSNKFKGVYKYNWANGIFSNITIISQIFTNATGSPSMSPTQKQISYLHPTTSYPTVRPTMNPTIHTLHPTVNPTLYPTFTPSRRPTLTAYPTSEPTFEPTIKPTLYPSFNPTMFPTPDPTPKPTHDPTKHPTTDPTQIPTVNPTTDPTIDPTVDPTDDPTVDPTNDPTDDPTADPTIDPTIYPTVDPTIDPTTDPTADPTTDPTNDPTVDPTIDPTIDPTLHPTVPPTHAPSTSPSDAPSTAPTYSPSQSPTWSPTANVLEIDTTLYQNVSLSCGTMYYRNTTENKEFDYYKLDLTQIEYIPKMVATTCCKTEPQELTMYIDDVEYIVTPNMTSYCGATSLDTVLYLLQYDKRKEYVSILTDDDDDTRVGFCHDGVDYGKSSIDISSMINEIEISEDIEYYIAVGGYTAQNDDNNGYTIKTGKYHIELLCDKYIFPLDSAQFLANIEDDNSKDIECGQTYVNQGNNDQKVASYYYFDIETNTDKPITVSTCDRTQTSNNYATYVYIASIQYYRQAASGFTIMKQDTLDDTNCNDGIDISSLDYDKYIIAIAGFNSTDPDNYGNLETGNFSITVSCGYPEEALDTVSLIIVISAASFVFICCCVCFWIWYCRTLKKYKQEHPRVYHGSVSNHERILSDSVELNAIGNAMKLKRKPDKLNRDKSIPNDVIHTRYRESIGGTVHEPDITALGRIAGRHLEAKDIQEHPDMDMIIAVMRDIIASCHDEQDLDVYQVLSFRRVNADSYKLRLFKPLQLLGIQYDVLNLSPWHRALFVALVVAGLQVVGITIILYSVTYEYFNDLQSSSACSWEAESWAESWMFKLLAFFWALVITLSLSTTLNGLNHTGFNQIIDRVKPENYSSLDIADVGVIYIGYLINLYTLLLAVFGSYFLVYSSEEGSGAIDMVLNAVALFFMIELDDLLVTHQDYEDVGAATDVFLKEYLEKHEKNVADATFQDDEKDREYEMETRQWFKEVGLLRLSKAVQYLVFIIQSIALCGGVIAPFVIFICYGNHDE